MNCGSKWVVPTIRKNYYRRFPEYAKHHQITFGRKTVELRQRFKQLNAIGGSSAEANLMENYLKENYHFNCSDGNHHLRIV